MTGFRWCLCLSLVGLAACSDLGTTPVLYPSPDGLPSTSETESDPPTEWPVRIRSTWADVLMGHSSPEAYIDATMRYDAYHASISTTATLRDQSGSSGFSFGPVERHTFIQFLNNFHGAQWRLRTPHSCGSILDVNVQFTAWWRGIGVDGEARYLNENASIARYGEQPACNTEQEGDESGENDNDGEEVGGGAGGPSTGTGGGGGGGGGSGSGGTGDAKYCWWQFNYVGESGEILEIWLVMCWYQ